MEKKNLIKLYRIKLKPVIQEAGRMVVIYFSGTGNSEYCARNFLKRYNGSNNVYSIEQEETAGKIKENREIVICYPVQFSNIPKILYDYIISHKDIWHNKKIFIIATMALFSGDGAGILARLLKKYGAVIYGGLHIKMPDSICDEKALKRTYKKNKIIVQKADLKIQKAVQNIKCGRPPKEGLGILCHMAGLFGQRLYFYNKTKKYSDKLKIHSQKCTGCGLCTKICPMENISFNKGVVVAGNKCTMCYRCINKCPGQAITLLGTKVIKQNSINKYI